MESEMESEKTETDLHVFDVCGAGEEVIVAASEADAREFCRTEYGDDSLDGATFEEYDDDDDLTINQEDRANPVTKTAGEWARENGRGHLCSCYA
jgi:hypothetical protein